MCPLNVFIGVCVCVCLQGVSVCSRCVSRTLKCACVCVKEFVYFRVWMQKGVSVSVSVGVSVCVRKWSVCEQLILRYTRATTSSALVQKQQPGFLMTHSYWVQHISF